MYCVTLRTYIAADVHIDTKSSSPNSMANEVSQHSINTHILLRDPFPGKITSSLGKLSCIKVN